VDTSGNISPTNTVKFTYVVVMPMSVAVTGKGSLTPNYNGKLLAINQNYSMLATPGAGFKFTNWTDSAGNVITNRATLRFTMATNLAFTANFVDVGRPILNIVSPTPNQHTTNFNFILTGKTHDNMAVAAVYYSFNGSSFALASTADNWANWAADLLLSPGTNFVQAYAVDTSGNISPTNTVKFVYLAVLTPLTVSINGNGSVTPNYNGKYLPINMGYSMTAAAGAGFKFTGWTGSITTSSATLHFIMSSNLSFTANFVDVARPTVNIVSPTANQHTTNSTFTLLGKAGDNVAVAAVQYSLNGGAWTNASTANNWTNWSDSLTLIAGTNIVQVCSVDTSGNISPTNTVKFVYVVPATSTVNVTTATPNFTPIISAPAVAPAVSAAPAPATLFTGWFTNGQYAFDVIGTTNAQYTVEASSNLVDWVSIQTNTAPFTCVDTDAGKFNQRYYRTVSTPTPVQ
jgi:uncharacterized repeat protein (TIGR02543 family)